jgi:3-oxoacyl-[acyl-carrier-protein] synthase III
MVSITAIHVADQATDHVALGDLGASHGLTSDQVRMYSRFFGLESVAQDRGALSVMLSAAVQGLLDQFPEVAESSGHLFYCKTQTHNTLADRSWLSSFARANRLAHWETSSVSMTSCASAIALMHFVRSARRSGPIMILTGEKAFHPSVSRLPVGLLGEVPAAALLNAGPGSWTIRGTTVRHLPRFFQNPDAMDPADRRALQSCYSDALHGFVAESLDHYQPLLRDDFVFLPHNLNVPMSNTIRDRFGWERRTFVGDTRRNGHAYCADIFLNLRDFETAADASAAPVSQVLVLAAGTGVTFATCLLERIDPA